MSKRIVIFASGSGSNAERIHNYFKEKDDVKLVAIFTNNSKAGVIDRARRLNIPCIVFKSHAAIFDLLFDLNIDLIVLAGYLKLIPASFIEAFPNKIINIHPALLPKYGGKGMYGAHVHQAVIENQEAYTGITIHFVNEQFDEGEIVIQERVAILESDTPETIAQKVHQLEYKYFAPSIQKILEEQD